jgi:glycine oxidase
MIARPHRERSARAAAVPLDRAEVGSSPSDGQPPTPARSASLQYASADVAIVGAGVVGCAIAYHLARAGARVAVYDRGPIGGGASGAAAGLLAPTGFITQDNPFARLAIASLEAFPALAEELWTHSGVNIRFDRCGALRLAGGLREAGRLRRRMTTWAALGMDAEWLGATALRALEPRLGHAAGAYGGVYVPMEAQAAPARVVAAFARAARRFGAQFHLGTAVERLITAARSAEAPERLANGLRLADGRTVAAGQFVLALGAWSALSRGLLGYALPVSPVGGQLLALRVGRGHRVPLHTMLFAGSFYAARKHDGAIWFGATREPERGFTMQISAAGTAQLRHAASAMLPCLAEAGISATWSGLRPRADVGGPLVGLAPGWTNVAVATGHGSAGILLAHLTGRAIAQWLLEGQRDERFLAFDVPRPLRAEGTLLD